MNKIEVNQPAYAATLRAKKIFKGWNIVALSIAVIFVIMPFMQWEMTFLLEPVDMRVLTETALLAIMGSLIVIIVVELLVMTFTFSNSEIPFSEQNLQKKAINQKLKEEGHMRYTSKEWEAAFKKRFATLAPISYILGVLSLVFHIAMSVIALVEFFAEYHTPWVLHLCIWTLAYRALNGVVKEAIWAKYLK